MSLLSPITSRCLLGFRRLNTTLNQHAINAVNSPKNGHIYRKRPFKYECKAGKAYMWCSCGWSRTQPFCDGTHTNTRLKISNKPLRFNCTETKVYWFCQCKQTKNRPFCDGSHQIELPNEGMPTIKETYYVPNKEE